MTGEAGDSHFRLALVAAVLSGALVALQQRLNGELGTQLDDAMMAAVVSFGTGLVVIAAVVLLRPSARAALPRLRRTSWWERLGGLGGASLVAVGAVAAPEIGVALLTVGLVAGQTAGGVLADRSGLGPSGRLPVTGPRLAGALVCLSAVALAGSGGGLQDADPLLLALVVGAGALVAGQQALNGRVRATTGDAGVATLLNFGVGTAALLVGLLVHDLADGDLADGGLGLGAWPGPAQAYLYLGGSIGVVFVMMAAVTVHVLGVLRLGLAVTAGQVLGAVVLDLIVPAAGTELAATTVLCGLLALVAVAVSGLGRRRALERAALQS